MNNSEDAVYNVTTKKLDEKQEYKTKLSVKQRKIVWINKLSELNEERIDK